MVKIDARCDGPMTCTLTHEDGASIRTAAPKDIGGDGDAFSPTDLVAAGLAACILTTIAMFAARHEIDITGARAHAEKEMASNPRRIGRLPVVVTLPDSVPLDMRSTLERVGRQCPVHASLREDIDAPIVYRYE
jgi:putative redox protein